MISAPAKVAGQAGRVERDRLTRTLTMNCKQFRRCTGGRTGMYPEIFAEMEAVLAEREPGKRKSGRPVALSVTEQLLMTLEFWRECRTLAHLGDDWGVHDDGVHRTSLRVEAALIASQQFQLPEKRVFQEAEAVCSIVAVDASEVPCEWPKKAGRPHTGAPRSAQDSSEGSAAGRTSATP